MRPSLSSSSEILWRLGPVNLDHSAPPWPQGGSVMNGHLALGWYVNLDPRARAAREHPAIAEGQRVLSGGQGMKRRSERKPCSNSAVDRYNVPGPGFKRSRCGIR